MAMPGKKQAVEICSGVHDCFTGSRRGPLSGRFHQYHDHCLSLKEDGTNDTIATLQQYCNITHFYLFIAILCS